MKKRQALEVAPRKPLIQMKLYKDNLSVFYIGCFLGVKEHKE